MSKIIHTAQQYWDERSDLFCNYYVKPTLFDRIFRKGIFTRLAVATKVCQEFDTPSILDIGSGPGINSVTFAKNSTARKIVGIDFAPNMVRYAENFSKEQGVSDKCQFIQDDFLTHDWKNEKFDICIALGVLDYIEQSENFVKKIDAITNKAFVISWPENGLRMALRRYRYTCPLFHYSENGIRSLHEKCKIHNLIFVKSAGGWVTVAYK